MTELFPSNEELLAAFADHLNAEAWALTISKKVVGARLDEVRRYVTLRHQLPQEHSKQEILDVVKSYAANHILQRMTQNDCALYPEGFDRDALQVFFGFLQIFLGWLQDAKVSTGQELESIIRMCNEVTP